MPARGLDPRHLRWIGSASLLVLGLALLGVPLPAWAPLATLGAGAAALGVRGALRRWRAVPRAQP